MRTLKRTPINMREILILRRHSALLLNLFIKIRASKSYDTIYKYLQLPTPYNINAEFIN